MLDQKARGLSAGSHIALVCSASHLNSEIRRVSCNPKIQSKTKDPSQTVSLQSSRDLKHRAVGEAEQVGTWATHMAQSKWLYPWSLFPQLWTWEGWNDVTYIKVPITIVLPPSFGKQIPQLEVLDSSSNRLLNTRGTDHPNYVNPYP